MAGCIGATQEYRVRRRYRSKVRKSIGRNTQLPRGNQKKWRDQGVGLEVGKCVYKG